MASVVKSTGARVSNAWIICPKVGDSPGKPGLIPHIDSEVKAFGLKGGDSFGNLPL